MATNGGEEYGASMPSSFFIAVPSTPSAIFVSPLARRLVLAFEDAVSSSHWSWELHSLVGNQRLKPIHHQQNDETLINTSSSIPQRGQQMGFLVLDSSNPTSSPPREIFVVSSSLLFRQTSLSSPSPSAPLSPSSSCPSSPFVELRFIDCSPSSSSSSQDTSSSSSENSEALLQVQMEIPPQLEGLISIRPSPFRNRQSSLLLESSTSPSSFFSSSIWCQGNRLALSSFQMDRVWIWQASWFSDFELKLEFHLEFQLPFPIPTLFLAPSHIVFAQPNGIRVCSLLLPSSSSSSSSSNQEESQEVKSHRVRKVAPASPSSSESSVALHINGLFLPLSPSSSSSSSSVLSFHLVTSTSAVLLTSQGHLFMISIFSSPKLKVTNVSLLKLELEFKISLVSVLSRGSLEELGVGEVNQLVVVPDSTSTSTSSPSRNSIYVIPLDEAERQITEQRLSSVLFTPTLHLRPTKGLFSDTGTQRLTCLSPDCIVTGDQHNVQILVLPTSVSVTPPS